MTTPSRCPVCDSDDLSVFWEASAVPVVCNVLCATRKEARRIPKGDIQLAYCRCCELITNLAFDPERIVYDVSYENSLHFSPRFQEYADALAARLISKYALRDKTIMEIACGNGEFLKTLCELGGNRGLGLDPSYDCAEPKNTAAERITFVRSTYSRKYAEHPADLICCRHALEHMADPLAFVQMVREGIGHRTQTIVYFEVPDATFTLKNMGIWDLIYEHCTYFVTGSLSRLFTRCGFEVLSVTREFDGQFLGIEAKVGGGSDSAGVGEEEPGTVEHEVRAFEGKYRDKLAGWQTRLAQLEKVVVWGSGSKGVMFLNLLRSADAVEYVVDVNPKKQGMYVAGTGHEIVSPEFLRQYRPSTVIVMNPIYAEEIRAMLGQIGLNPAILVA